jgi:hypothetical protein
MMDDGVRPDVHNYSVYVLLSLAMCSVIDRGPLSRNIKQTENPEFAHRDKEYQKLVLITIWLSECSDQTTSCKIEG